MEEPKRRQWKDYDYLDEDVKQLSLIISNKATEKSLETLHGYLKNDTNLLKRREARCLFLTYIAKCNTNKVLKNEFLKQITSGRKDFTLFSTIIIESIKDVLDNEVEETLWSSKNTLHLLPVVNVFYQLCIDKDDEKVVAVLNEIVPMYDIILKTFTSELEKNFDAVYNFKNEDLLPLANQAMKQVLGVFINKPDLNINKYILKFLDYSYKVLTYDKIAMDMKFKCALIFVQCLGRLPDDELEHFVHKETPMLEVTNETKESSDWIRGKTFSYANLLNRNSVKVSLFSAVYSCLSIEKQLSIMLTPDRNVFQVIFNEMLKCTEKPISENAEIVEVTKSLMAMSDTLSKLQPDAYFYEIFGRCISYANAFCDYHMDVVQRHASLFLGQLIKISCNHYNNGTEGFLNHLLASINLKEGKRKIDFLRIMYICTHKSTEFLLKNVPFLREQLTLLLEDPVCREHAAAAYEHLMKGDYSEKKDRCQRWLNLWVRPALAQLKRTQLDRIPIYQDLLCKAFKINPQILPHLFPNNYMGSHREWAVLLKCLNDARNTKPFTLGGYDATIYWRGLIEKTKLRMFSFQRDDTIRIAALKVLVECQKSTEFFTEWEFTYLIDYYQVNGCNQIPSLRKQISGLYKKMFTRYFASLEVIKKKLENLEARPNLENEKKWIDSLKRMRAYYRYFLERLMKQLTANIAPDGNFYRRNLALELLMFLQPSMDQASWSTYWKSDDVENLKQILLDSYEMNKRMAIAILSKFDTRRFNFDDTEYNSSYLSEALSLACDIKPSKSLSAAYMFQLCTYSIQLSESARGVEGCNEDNEMVLNHIILLADKLNTRFELMERITETDMNSPFYGILTCLRYLIRYRLKSSWNKRYAETFRKIFSKCYDIFRVVLQIVKNRAPEGYLPENEETDVQIRDDTANSQKILVFAWRTIKEVTLLFAEFACQDLELKEHRVMEEKDHHLIVECFRLIFIQAKHRGVFEQAYVGFCMLCECYWKCSQDSLREVPNVLLREGLNFAAGKSIDLNITPYRRSAGMPFLILAILTTDPSLDKAAFHKAMKELSTVAAFQDKEKMENKIHAMNILRFIIRHTKLSDYIAPYIEGTVQLALNGINSQEWGVRNSSTLLFSALVTRLFGVQRTQDSEDVTMKNKMTVKVFCLRYPVLFNFLVDTMKTECDKRDSLILHPILLVFSRLYPSHLDPSDTKIEEVIPYIRKCLKNPSVEVRKLAARASMALVLIKNLHKTVIFNFSLIANRTVGNNECHGLLLEIWYILKYLGTHLELPVSTMIASTIHVLEEAGNKFSHHCVSLYMDILSFLFGKLYPRYDDRADLDTLRRILTSISRLMEEQNLNLTGRKNFEAAMINLTITILLVRLEHVETTFQAINFDFENYMMVNQGRIMKTYCLHFVLFVNITYNENDLQDPPLLIFDELNVPETVKDVTNNFSKPTQCEFLTYIHKFMVGYLKTEFERVVDVRDDCFVLNLLILPYYPCVLRSLQNGDRQKTMDMLINFCSCDREDVISAVITCIGVLLTQYDIDYCSLDYSTLIRLLRRSVLPEAAVHRRLSVCQFLLKCKFLYYGGATFMTYDLVMEFLSIVLILLEDEALRIRNEISALTDNENIVLIDEHSKCGWKCTPEKSRLDFFKHCCKILPRPLHVAFMLGWTIRHFPDQSNDRSEVFERSELNSYAENVHYLQTAGKVLSQNLWDLEFDLSFKDCSIFMQEQCQVVTTILLDASNGYSFPMVDRRTKVSVICAFKSILNHLDGYQVNVDFKSSLTEHFQRKILPYLKRQVCQKDYHSVKTIFLHLYEPVLLEEKFK